mmetsp:Transcript_15523/g.45831  ORF Transcript_15523/g.45831 Transcript_15523/m.45831 type:complete len:207 (+) Transcript_15523:1838-2458(+)
MHAYVSCSGPNISLMDSQRLTKHFHPACTGAALRAQGQPFMPRATTDLPCLAPGADNAIHVCKGLGPAPTHCQPHVLTAPPFAPALTLGPRSINQQVNKSTCKVAAASPVWDVPLGVRHWCGQWCCMRGGIADSGITEWDSVTVHATGEVCSSAQRISLAEYLCFWPNIYIYLAERQAMDHTGEVYAFAATEMQLVAVERHGCRHL